MRLNKVPKMRILTGLCLAVWSYTYTGTALANKEYA